MRSLIISYFLSIPIDLDCFIISQWFVKIHFRNLTESIRILTSSLINVVVVVVFPLTIPLVGYLCRNAYFYLNIILFFMYRHTCIKIIKYCVWLLSVSQPNFNILINVITYLNKQKRTIGYILSQNPYIYCYRFVIHVTTKLNRSVE